MNCYREENEGEEEDKDCNDALSFFMKKGFGSVNPFCIGNEGHIGA